MCTCTLIGTGNRWSHKCFGEYKLRQRQCAHMKIPSIYILPSSKITAVYWSFIRMQKRCSTESNSSWRIVKLFCNGLIIMELVFWIRVGKKILTQMFPLVTKKELTKLCWRKFALYVEIFSLNVKENLLKNEVNRLWICLLSNQQSKLVIW